MNCPFCKQEHKPQRRLGQDFIVCPECPEDKIYLLPRNEASETFWLIGESLPDQIIHQQMRNAEIQQLLLEKAIAHKQCIDEHLRLICGFWVPAEEHEFAEAVYLAMDWPTFPDVRCL